MAATESPKILTPEDVSAKLGNVAVQTLYNWRNLSKNGAQLGPRSFKIGRLVRYYESDVDAWVEGLRAQSSAS
jgi:predicted DNA-binding transcriptional regulator AlpA